MQAQTSKNEASKNVSLVWDIILWGLLIVLAMSSVPILMDMPERVMRRLYLFGFLVVPPAVGLVGLQMVFGRHPPVEDPELLF